MTVYYTASAEKKLSEISRRSSDQARKLIQKISEISPSLSGASRDNYFSREDEDIFVFRINEYRVFYTVSGRDIYILDMASKYHNPWD